MLYQTHARIHLGNIRANIENIRKVVGSGRKILIAVKADAYGHGAVAVSRMAEHIGVDWLGVATVPEGIELRDAGIRLPILKFSPAFPEEIPAALQNSLTFTVVDRESARMLQAAALSSGVIARAHLKVDTGMGRIGTTPEEAPAVASYIEKLCPSVRLGGVFTHLPVSDDKDPSYTREQVGRFKAVVDSVNTALGRRLDFAHCSNSGAVLAHDSGWMDLVRPGIIVYGQYPDPETPRTIPLLPGLSLYTRISFIKRIPKGTSVSYGRTWTAPRDTFIGTIPVGYADGFNRLFSNRGRVLVGGQSYPVVGRVCMDQSMIDLGSETDVRVGDEVVLMGRSGTEEIDCAEWAKLLDTIPYEITCRIDSRVNRIYDPY